MKKKIFLIILLAALIIPFGVALAHETAAGYQIPWDAYASGGEQMASTSYSITGTAGQSIVGGTSSSNAQIGAGFWTVFTETLSNIFLPIIYR